MKKIIFLSVLFFNSLVLSIEYPLFDKGPDPKDPMQKELLDIITDMPYLPGISKELQVLVPSYKRGQKMRPDFGAMPLRGFLLPNSISVLVIGQDGTHIAEGANRPGIAGFGGRVHDMLKHFGIFEGVLFTNLYVNTISGQYGSRNTPVLKDDKTIEFRNVIENRQWLMTHEGPYGEWRNRFLSWVIRNNKKSLKMVMMLGQAGKDAGANFINFIGGSVSARKNIGTGYRYNVPLFEMKAAGGNNEWAVALTKDGKDVAEVLRSDDVIRNALKEKLEAKIAKQTSDKKIKVLKKRIKALDKKLNYKDGTKEAGISTENAKSLLIDNAIKAKELMVFTKGGPKNNGVLYPEQFGGWDLKTMKVLGKTTRSIKGLKIPCLGSKAGDCETQEFITAPDIVFVGAPHPTSLSMGEMTKRGSAAIKVEKELLVPLKSEVKRGWEAPKPESGLTSAFLEGKPYKYRRGAIPVSHGDPGITDLRLLPVSTAKRQGSSMIVIGTRDRANFSKEKIKSMQKDTPSNKDLVKSNFVLTGRAKFDDWKYKYDRGPSDEYAKLLFKSLDKKTVLWVKKEFEEKALEIYNKKFSKSKKTQQDELDAYGKATRAIFTEHGIDAFHAKTHPEAGFFGHYRGSFNKPKIIMLVDPEGYDSFITSKAATGNRGQYIHGLISDLGIESEYLIINTVPFGMDGANDEDWKVILEKTQNYRDELFKKLISDNPNALFLSDGKRASLELNRIFSEEKIGIKRTKNIKADMIKAGKAIKSKYKKYSKSKITGKRKDIPREHLTWIARVWEGTSGDRVITATDKSNKGKAFGIIAPNWARKNKVHFTSKTKKGLLELHKKLVYAGEPQAGEKISQYLERRKDCFSFHELKVGVWEFAAKNLCTFSTKLSNPSETIPVMD